MTATRTRYIPGSIVQRLGALLVDMLLFSVSVALPATLISWWFGPPEFTSCTFSGSTESCSITPEALAYTRKVFYTLAAVFVLAYSATITHGASLGKKATELMVVDNATGDTISYRRAVVRTVLSVISVCFFGLGMLVGLTNPQRRTAHDLITGTRVISP